MLSRAVHRQDDAALKPFGLLRRRCFKRLTMGPEPGLDNPVAMHPFVDAAGNGFHLW
jgi:hypothetical protein